MKCRFFYKNLLYKYLVEEFYIAKKKLISNNPKEKYLNKYKTSTRKYAHFKKK